MTIFIVINLPYRNCTRGTSCVYQTASDVWERRWEGYAIYSLLCQKGLLIHQQWLFPWHFPAIFSWRSFGMISCNSCLPSGKLSYMGQREKSMTLYWKELTTQVWVTIQIFDFSIVDKKSEVISANTTLSSMVLLNVKQKLSPTVSLE